MINDPEVQLLAALAEGLRDEYQTEEDLSLVAESLRMGQVAVVEA